MTRIIALALLVSSIGLCACDPPATEPTAVAAPTVSVIHPRRGSIERTITLPGDVIGYYQSPLYAKVTGYLKAIYVDKGDTVKAGEVLATIEVPELKQQVARAQANLEVQHLTYQRLHSVWQNDSRLVAREDVDIAYGKYLEAKAQTEELDALNSYTTIVAPFDGVVTERFVDPGALIHAGGELSATAPMQGSARPGGAAAPVVSIARIDRLRIYLYVPQGEVAFVRQGMPASVSIHGLNGLHFAGSVVRYAHSLDLATRTMLTEVDLVNSTHQLYPGMYADVTLVLERHPDALRLPTGAIGGSRNNEVLLVRDGRLEEQPVRVGMTDPNYLEILSGVSLKDLVVSRYSNTLQPGEKVVSDLDRKNSTLIASGD